MDDAARAGVREQGQVACELQRVTQALFRVDQQRFSCRRGAIPRGPEERVPILPQLGKLQPPVVFTPALSELSVEQ